MSFSQNIGPNWKKEKIARLMSEHGVYQFLAIFSNVFYDFLKNAAFRVKSEAINRFYGEFP